MSTSVKKQTKSRKVSKKNNYKTGEPEYDMEHKYRGFCTVFSHDEFTNGLKPRLGNKMDEESIKRSFGSLGYNVTICRNFTLQEIENELAELGDCDQSDCDSLVIIVLTHGGRRSRLYASDCSYHPELIWEAFSEVQDLVGKPKLIFVQSCRGSKVNLGILKIDGPSTSTAGVNEESDSSSEDEEHGPIHPVYADFLYFCSTIDGYVSMRNERRGTLFIQSLCSSINEKGNRLEIHALLVAVNRLVSAHPSQLKKFKNVMQCSILKTTLRKALYHE